MMVDRAGELFCVRSLSCGLLLQFIYICYGAIRDHTDDVLLCRQCGHEVAHADSLVTVTSPHALDHRNDTVLGINGVLIQLFENPNGRRYELITSNDADVFKHDKVVKEFSWFPGFAWRISVCPRCGFHLGWFFEPTTHDHSHKGDESFIGLILENLLHQDYADSLLVIPKSYRS